MKKINYIICSLMMTVGAMVLSSCGDNGDFWGLHTLTDDEIAEIARQDSIKNAQKNNINADLILNYSVDIPLSSTSYDGGSVQVDMDKIADLFGISKENLLAAIGGTDNGFDVKGFAIEGTTHADNGTSTNTGSTWGHWWDASGNVVAWGTNAMVFAEFNPDTSVFNVGQYPGHLTAGQSIKFIEALKYQGKRVAVVITANAVAREQVQATVVNTQKLTLSTTAKSVYDSEVVPGFDSAKLISDLGVSSLSDVTWIATNADGSYATEYSAEAPGYWYDKDGFAGAWGDKASVYTGISDNSVVVGQMPDNNAAGSSVTIHYGAMANNKIEMLEITVTFKEYQDPETAPSGTPASIEKDLTLTKAYSSDYASVSVDIKDQLREAFKMTTYQIFKAIKSGDLKVFIDKTSDTAPTYTADAPGYWLDADGKSTAYASGLVFVNLVSSETSLTLAGGNHPDNCSKSGQTVKTKYIIACNGVTATYNITFAVTTAAQAKKHRR